MSDLDYQKFAVRLDAAAASGIITQDQLRLAKATLEGGGMDAAISALQASNMMKDNPEPENEEKTEPGPDSGSRDPRLELAEDLADLRDELNRDLGSAAARELVRKIAAMIDLEEDAL